MQILDSSIIESWAKTSGQWVTSMKYEQTSYAKGNNTLTTHKWYQWDKNTNQWVYHSKSEYTYDVNGTNILFIYYQWDKTNSRWIFNTKSTSYYSEHSSLPEISEQFINVYPNPATEYIVFDIINISDSAIVEIFDNQGKKVLEKKLSSTGEISIRNMGKGLYLYRLNNSGNVYTGRIIIE